VYDGAPFAKHFGDVTKDVKPAYVIGQPVSVDFVGANPRNNLRLEQTFAAVETLDPSTGAWKQIRDDSDWSLIYNWKRTSELLGTSEVEIQWLTETTDKVGKYRIKYYGDSKAALGGKITAFVGTSAVFVLT